MSKDSFVFYGSFYDAIKTIKDNDQRVALYDAITGYAITGELPQLDGFLLGFFLLMKPQIDANNKRFENGNRGGRPSKQETETKPNNNQTETEQKPNNNQTETEQKPNNNQTITKPKPNKNQTETEAEPNVNDNVNVNVNALPDGRDNAPAHNAYVKDVYPESVEDVLDIAR